MVFNVGNKKKSRLDPSLFFMKFSLASALASMSWLMLTLFSFCPSVGKWMNFALMRCIWNFPVKIAWQDPTLMPISSETSRTFKRDFHETPHALSQHGGRLLMWKVVQAWGLHCLFYTLWNSLTTRCIAYESCTPLRKLASAIQMFPHRFFKVWSRISHTRVSS